MHSLSVRVRLKPPLIFTPPNGILGSQSCVLLNPHHAGPKLSRNTMSTLQIIRKDRCAKTIGLVVGSINSLVFGSVNGDDNHRTEDLFPVHAYALLDAGDDRGLHVEAFLSLSDVRASCWTIAAPASLDYHNHPGCSRGKTRRPRDENAERRAFRSLDDNCVTLCHAC
jgi:hypothetical protein